VHAGITTVRTPLPLGSKSCWALWLDDAWLLCWPGGVTVIAPVGAWPLDDCWLDEHGCTVRVWVSELFGSTTWLAPAGICDVVSVCVPHGGTTMETSLACFDTTSERAPGCELELLCCELEPELDPELEPLLELLLEPHEASAPARTSIARIAITTLVFVPKRNLRMPSPPLCCLVTASREGDE
jgi:hypothetical protein